MVSRKGRPYRNEEGIRAGGSGPFNTGGTDARVCRRKAQPIRRFVIRRPAHLIAGATDAADRILEELRASGKEHVHIAEDRPVHDAITCFENHPGDFDYASAPRQGLPIGSSAGRPNKLPIDTRA